MLFTNYKNTKVCYKQDNCCICNALKRGCTKLTVHLCRKLNSQFIPVNTCFYGYT